MEVARTSYIGYTLAYLQEEMPELPEQILERNWRPAGQDTAFDLCQLRKDPFERLLQVQGRSDLGPPGLPPF